jgi:hypothetical protein
MKRILAPLLMQPERQRSKREIVRYIYINTHEKERERGVLLSCLNREIEKKRERDLPNEFLPF